MQAEKCGMQGRLLGPREHHLEIQTNYAGAAAMRCNLDAQCLGRVLPVALWKPRDASKFVLPSVGVAARRPGPEELGTPGLCI